MIESATPNHLDQQLPKSNAEAYMYELNGELVGSNFIAGWSERAKHLESDEPSQDAVYAYLDPESGEGRFAVFDGMGGYQNGQLASQAARQFLHQESLNNGATNPADNTAYMGHIFDQMAEAVEAEIPSGGTTAFVGILRKTSMEDGYDFDWGLVGDSLGFIVSTDGSVKRLGKEETLRQKLLDDGRSMKEADKSGNVLTNALAAVNGRSSYRGLTQQGTERLKTGDKVLIVSDGITGDGADQELPGGNHTTICGVLSKPGMTPKQRADVLVQIARKIDDRTALVIEVGDHSAATNTEAGEESVLDHDPETTLPPLAPGSMATRLAGVSLDGLPPRPPKHNPKPKS